MMWKLRNRSSGVASVIGAMGGLQFCCLQMSWGAWCPLLSSLFWPTPPDCYPGQPTPSIPSLHHWTDLGLVDSQNIDLFTRLDAASDVLEHQLQARSVTCAVVLEFNNAICRPITRQDRVADSPRCLWRQKHHTIVSSSEYLTQHCSLNQQDEVLLQTQHNISYC